MTVVTIHKAKTELSKLLKRVEAGEEIIIARGDKQIAKLSPAGPLAKKLRVPGSMPDSFFDPLSEEELKLWEGGD